MQLSRKLIIAGNVIAFIAVAIAALALKATKSTRRPPNNPSKTMLAKAVKLEADGAFKDAAMAYQASLKRLNATDRVDAQKGYWRAQAQALLSLVSTDPDYVASFKAHTEMFYDPRYKVDDLSQLIRMQNALYTRTVKTVSGAGSIAKDWSIWLTWLKAQAASMNDEPNLALKSLEPFLLVFPDHRQGLVLRYKLANELKLDALALRTARHLTKLQPSSVLTTEIAEILIRTGGYPEARELMKGEIEANGATTTTVLLLSRAHLEAGDGKEAALVLTRAMDLVSNPKALAKGIELLRRRGYPDLADRLRKRLTTRTPSQ
ncbi:MAG: hypothetical protein VYA30_05060 [Myxococcota bacterium]|nr:hypothetical protein [Myxococcota bacterium]